MNIHIGLTITNHVTICKNFLYTLRLAALKDDGVMDKSEKKQIKKLTHDYIKELEKVKIEK